MTSFEQQFFKKEAFASQQIQQYFESARHALKIADRDEFAEVRFDYAYKALIKIGIGLVSKSGYRVRSVPGHHIKLIQKISELLKDKEIFEIGNSMRLKRNEDFYGCGDFISESEATEFLDFVKTVLKRSEKLIQK